MTGLVVTGMSARHRHGPTVVHEIDLRARRGRLTALLGPNGAGKSTLLKGILGLVPTTGVATLDGVSLHTLPRLERARHIAYVPQRTQLRARLTVEEVVAQGRFAHPRSPDGPAIVDQALADADVQHLAGRPFLALSGGEQARVILARALATGATALLLDEPGASLDLRHGLELFAVLRRLAERGACVLVVLHDVSQAHRHVDEAVLLDGGRVFAAGPVDAVIAARPVRSVYGVELLENESFSWRLPGGPT